MIKGLFLYANAGQIRRCFIEKNWRYSSSQPDLSCLVLTPNSKFETDSINFYNGDVLVIYSDGVVEAANDKFEFYGDDKLRQIVLDSVNLSPKEIAATILEDVIKFSTNESKYQDDKTIVVIKRTENMDLVQKYLMRVL